MKASKVFLRTAGAVGDRAGKSHGASPRGREGTFDRSGNQRPGGPRFRRLSKHKTLPAAAPPIDAGR